MLGLYLPQDLPNAAVFRMCGESYKVREGKGSEMLSLLPRLAREISKPNSAGQVSSIMRVTTADLAKCAS